MTAPIIYDATPDDLRAAIIGIRGRVRNLKEPRLYQLAVALCVMLKSAQAVQWRGWDRQPPTRGLPVGKMQYIGAMDRLFGTSQSRLIRSDRDVLENSPRVLIDVLFGANSDLVTLVNPDTKRSVKLCLESPSWIWQTTEARDKQPRTVEYNPVNSLNTQNGVRCDLPIARAKSQHTNAEAIYTVDRSSCQYRQTVPGSASICSLSGKDCGSMGGGVDRQATKPRLLAPATDPMDPNQVLLPNALDVLVARATRGGGKLPRAQDLSLLVAWCHASSAGSRLQHSRINDLLGSGIAILTSED